MTRRFDFDDDDEPFERRILRRLEHISQQLEEIAMSQADIDAAIATLQADETGLDASVVRITQWITDHPDVDTSGLTAEVANLQTHVDAVSALAAPAASRGRLAARAQPPGRGPPPL